MDRRQLLKAGALAGLAGIGRGAPVGAAPWRPSPSAAGQPLAEASPEAAERTLWLNWNENPLGLSPSARAAATAAIDRGHRYPDAARERLTEALAAREGVAAASVVLGCGSTQLLEMVVQASAAPDALLVAAEPTFGAVLGYQRPHGYRVERVPLDAAHGHDLERMAATAGRHEGPVLVYVCNPNNPTGTLTPSAALDAWIEAAPERVVFLIDEAYHEYVRAPGYRSAADWAGRRPGVVVTRTFSKLYAMAGLRLGYAVAHPETARRLTAVVSRDNANGVALAAAEAAIADPELLRRSRASNEAALRIVHDGLDELGIGHLPTHANFLMHRVAGDLEVYISRMREHGIRVGRPFPPMLGYNRLSLGLPEEMERFTEVLRTFRERGWV